MENAASVLRKVSTRRWLRWFNSALRWTVISSGSSSSATNLTPPRPAHCGILTRRKCGHFSASLTNVSLWWTVASKISCKIINQQFRSNCMLLVLWCSPVAAPWNLRICPSEQPSADVLPTTRADRTWGWCHLSRARKFQSALREHLFAKFALADFRINYRVHQWIFLEFTQEFNLSK